MTNQLPHLYPHTPAVIAHRGASYDAPENTLPAFELAIDQGADAVELDTKLTQDGVVVVMHDPTVDRTTDGSGSLAGMTLADLRALDAGAWKGSEFAGTRVPTLAEVVEAVSDRVWINVEIGNYFTRGDGLEAAVVALIHRMDIGRRVLISAFNPLSLRKIHKLDANLPLALLTHHRLPIYLRRAWLAPITPHAARHPTLQQTTPASVATFHRRGLRVNAYIVNEREDIVRLARLGVDGIITDRPALAKDVIREA